MQITANFDFILKNETFCRIKKILNISTFKLFRRKFFAQAFF